MNNNLYYNFCILQFLSITGPKKKKQTEIHFDHIGDHLQVRLKMGIFLFLGPFTFEPRSEEKFCS